MSRKTVLGFELGLPSAATVHGLSNLNAHQNPTKANAQKHRLGVIDAL